jgi:hypothetical protein
MENKKILFITFDMSGYYDGVHAELLRRYGTVDYFNTAKISYKYKNVFEKAYSFFYKIFTGQKLKNFYKYKNLVDSVEGKSYDIALIIRPDVFFDSQLEIVKKSAGYFVAFYHDSINNIKRKKDVIHFFDKVCSYEKKDVADYNLSFISNFIYFDTPTEFPTVKQDAFSVMSNDYRVSTLKNMASYLCKNGLTYNFYVADDEPKTDNLITFITRRMSNPEVISEIQKSNIIVDIHKYGIQDGLTFRVFESIGFRKKLITTNQDIKTYDFYDPNNIFVIEDHKNINVPDSFFKTPYKDIPQEIYSKYTVPMWLDQILKRS